MTSGLKHHRVPRAYSITQLCREFGVTPRAMRFYEEQGLLSPGRQGLARVYTYRDRARLELVVRGRKVGLSLAEIRDILETYDEEGEEAQNAKALEIFARRIEALEAQRVEVDRALDTLRAAARRLADRTAPAAGMAAE